MIFPLSWWGNDKERPTISIGNLWRLPHHLDWEIVKNHLWISWEIIAIPLVIPLVKWLASPCHLHGGMVRTSPTISLERMTMVPPSFWRRNGDDPPNMFQREIVKTASSFKSMRAMSPPLAWRNGKDSPITSREKWPGSFHLFGGEMVMMPSLLSWRNCKDCPHHF